MMFIRSIYSQKGIVHFKAIRINLSWHITTGQISLKEILCKIKKYKLWNDLITDENKGWIRMTVTIWSIRQGNYASNSTFNFEF